jgi:methyl-accepting chemotaxis protein
MNDLSQRDLTVRAPVSDDVIGTVADSVNYLTESTSAALQQVSNVAGQVQTVSDNVRAQSQAVSGAVTDAQTELGSMTQILQRAAETLRGVAQLAEVSNKAAGQTSNASRAAQVAVNDTVQGMQAIREQIGEMEKRIKRLGERSQEISQVVGLINTISERTHVLALNASMQAAQAGEAGRGFAAVAEEVQRLADSVRQSTQQIASLVQNIQLETNDTVTTVNRVIDQVVKGSEAAQRSNIQMEITERSTSQLVQAVQRIATASQAQVKIAEALQVSVGDITRTTERTAEQVRAQNHSTSLLTEAAAKLVATVGEFRLPEQAA